MRPSDRADAFVTLESGEKLWLDEMHLTGKVAGMVAAIPFSFAYGSKSSAQLFPAWKRFQAKRPSKFGCFRRPASPYAYAEAALRGLDPGATYTLTYHPGYAAQGSRRLTGGQLARLAVELPSAPASLLIRYDARAR